MTEAQEQQEEIVVQNNEAVQEQQKEQTPEIEVVNEEQEAPTPPVEQKKQFDPKTDKVEFTTPEQQEKFNYIYKQVKMSDARNQMLTDLLQQQQKRLDEVEGRFKKTDSATAEQMLIARIKQARDAGDDLGEIAATRDMVEFLADRKIAEKAPAPAYNQQPNNQVAPEAVKYTQEFMNATDEQGQPLRPYLQETHPEFNTAISTLQDISQKYIGDPYALPKSLAELEQTMRSKMTQKPPVQPRAPSPMQGGNLTNQSPKATIKMTRAELEIARKLGVDPKKYAAKRDALAQQKGKK